MTSLDWIKRIDDSILELTPPISARSFPLKEVEKALGTLFEQPQLQLEASGGEWKKPSFSSKEHLFSIRFYPLKNLTYFSIHEDDLKNLAASLLGGEKSAAPFIEPPELIGFSHYLGLEVLSVMEQIGFAQDLNPRLEEAERPSLERAFVIPVVAKMKEGSARGALILPETFTQEWKEHFAHLPKPALTKEEKEKIPVALSIEIGGTRLRLNEWKEVKKGDFVVLDQTSFDPETKKGRVILTLNGNPIFRGKIREEGIKILEYPLYEEMGEPMDEAFEEEEVEEFDLEEDEPAPEKKSDHITPEKIEVTLTIEAGRIKMNVEELLALAPGSLIDLKIEPEQGVDLVVNGKKVGRGELVKLGEVLGVRVLKL